MTFRYLSIFDYFKYHDDKKQWLNKESSYFHKHFILDFQNNCNSHTD